MVSLSLADTTATGSFGTFALTDIGTLKVSSSATNNTLNSGSGGTANASMTYQGYLSGSGDFLNVMLNLDLSGVGLSVDQTATGRSSYADFSLFLSGTHGFVGNSGFMQLCEAVGTVTLGMSCGSGTTFRAGGILADQTATSLSDISFSVTLPVNQLFQFTILASSTTNVGGTGFATSSFADSVTFPFFGPVLNLPAGYTFNSVDARITDNQFAAAVTPVPEPASLLLLGSGIAGLAVKARRKKRQPIQ